ncbi:MAG: nicotinamide-nucleotide amidohydrolase family protein [Lachnospiraceae bacterium]|nr:nicotinamide-nucleotide amidohydrolase family protein [Lachnospiraceae bacterium]
MIWSKTVKIAGVDEAVIKENIKGLSQGENPVIIVSSDPGEVYITIEGTGEDESEAKKLVKPLVKELKSRYGAMIYSTGEATLEETVVDLLEKNSLTISTAESCTGGLLSGRIINVPGASEIIKVGFVTYSNKAKRKYLGVKKSTLDKYGAVSEQCAREMVKGLTAQTKADVGLSTTGIAGPDGGTEDKPVGLVYIGCNVCGSVKVMECHFSGTRSEIRQRTVAEALNLLRMCILEFFTETKLK